MLELGMVNNQYTVHVAYSDLINERYIDNSLFDDTISGTSKTLGSVH